MYYLFKCRQNLKREQRNAKIIFFENSISDVIGTVCAITLGRKQWNELHDGSSPWTNGQGVQLAQKTTLELQGNQILSQTR
jgi:hypothetical protein